MSEDSKIQERSSGVTFKFNRSSILGTRVVSSCLESEEKFEDEEKDYLTSVVGKKLKSVIPKPGPKEYVIPLIKTNKWRVPSNSKDISSVKNDTTEADINELAAKAILNDIATGKFLNKTADTDEVNEGLVIPLIMQNKPPVELEDDKLSDLPFRPDESSLNDYSNMPIEHYGAAMLKGMGWKPGQPIGLNKNGLVEPIEYIAHPGGLGLGATPRPPDPKKKKQQIKKMGQVEEKRPTPYKDKDGRVRHIKKIGEVIPEQRPDGFYVGNFAVVCNGPHKDLYGKIIAVDEDNARVVLKLAINNENLAFSQYHLSLVSEEEFEKYGKNQKKQYGLIVTNKQSSSDNGKRSKDHSNDVKAKKYKGSYAEAFHDHKLSQDSHRHSSKGRDRDYENHDKHHKRYKAAEEVIEVKRHKVDTDCWMAPNLRVRIIDREFKNGQCYNKKVKIVDVIDMSSCVCQVDDGILLENVTQSMLETVVPRTANSHVMIVGGKNKGKLASIIKRYSSEYKVLVRLIFSDELLTLDYDLICEFTGDIDTFS